MARRSRLVTTVAALAVGLTLGTSACSGEETPPAPDAHAQPSAPTPPERLPVVVNAVEPARRLLPADIGDDYGARIGGLLYRGLLRYDVKGRLVEEVADSVTADSPTQLRVKLKRGWYFTDGQPVTAWSFVNAWSFAADPAHAQLHADAFAPIVGWHALRGQPEPTPVPVPTASGTASGDATASATPTSTEPTAPSSSPSSSPTDATGTPAPGGTTPSAPATGAVPAGAPTLSGLHVISDTEFTIRLTQPDATFRDRLATLPFAPLPSAALLDPATATVDPIGNGPYQVAGGWVAGKEIRLLPNASYKGSDPARNGGVTFRFFPDPAVAYPALLAGRLDVLDAIPLPALGRYKADLGFRGSNQSVGAVTSLVFPMNQPQWATPAGLAVRRAFSRSIDRAALAQGLFAQTRAAAGDYAAPVVPGQAADLCGTDCKLDPQAAKQLLAAVPQPVAPLQIAYGVDAGGLPAVEALCSAFTAATAVECTPFPVASQAALDRGIATHEVTVPALVTRRMSRPELGGFLTPRFSAASSFNPSSYADPTVESLFAKAAATPDANARTDVYRQAEQRVLTTLPEVPLWSVNSTVATGNGMQPAKIDPFGLPLYTELQHS